MQGSIIVECGLSPAFSCLRLMISDDMVETVETYAAGAGIRMKHLLQETYFSENRDTQYG